MPLDPADPAASPPPAPGTDRRDRLPFVSLVVPMYNEADALDLFFAAVTEALAFLDGRYEIVCVNDGSRDGTLAGLLAWHRRDPRIRVVDLSRNFGKEAALTAGLDHAAGEVVIPIDADLQDPPNLIRTFIDRWQDGYDVVYGVRLARPEDGPLKRTTARGFYRLFNCLTPVPLPADAGDFRLLDRRVVAALRRLPERNRFMKGLFAWVGFPAIGVGYVRPARQAGTTKWNYWKLWNFALDGIVGFSTWPLRLWSYFGVAVAASAFVYAAFLVTRTLIQGRDLPGYASLMAAILFLGGVQLISLGVIGEYLGRLGQEVKARPLYLVNRRYGLPESEAGGGADAGTAAAPPAR